MRREGWLAAMFCDQARPAAGTVFLLLMVIGLLAMGRQAQSGAPVKEIVFTKELTIGVVEGDENYMFGKSIGFSADGLGNMYILDWDRKHIRKFAPDGKYLLTFGRQGQGPGEFTNPSTVRFAPDGSLYVSENWGNRLYFFDSDGRFLRQVTLPEHIYDIWITPAGTRLGIRHMAPRYVGQGATEDTHTIFDDQFRPILELYKDVVDLKFPEDRSLAQRLADIHTYFLARPNPVAAMSDDGRIYFGLTNTYAIDVYSPEGRKLRTISRDIPAAEYTRADIDFALKQYDESSSVDRTENERKEIRRLIQFPKYKPFFSAIIPMEKGLLGVLTDWNSLEACTLDIFGDDGQFVGRVRAAISPYGLTFKNGKAYCVRTDENGYHFVERYGYLIR
jgi:hypothetical protein